MFNSHEETTGERAIKAELRHLKLRYEQEKEIFGLKGDHATHRVADFYLPEYDVYIEFLGSWNTSPHDRHRYEEKRRVYKLNNIKCIYIKPDQLYFCGKVIHEGLMGIPRKSEPITQRPAEHKPEQNTSKSKNPKNILVRIIRAFILWFMFPGVIVNLGVSYFTSNYVSFFQFCVLGILLFFFYKKL